MTKELSLGAQAVLDAASNVYWDWTDMSPASPQTIATATLRAAADQVVPKEAPEPTGMRPCVNTFSARWIMRAERMKMRKQLLAIANELEAQ